MSTIRGDSKLNPPAAYSTTLYGAGIGQGEMCFLDNEEAIRWLELQLDVAYEEREREYFGEDA